MTSYPQTLAPVLDPLTPVQREAAMALGRVLVLAGAGTGKTKTLTAGVACRIQMYGMRPSQILCVTFTNKAAQEMRERITSVLGEGQAPFWLGTFHGLGARQLRAEPEVAQLHSGFDIRDADDATALIRRLMKAMDPDTVPEPDTGKKCDVRQVKKMGERIGHMKENLVTPEAAPAWVRGLIERRRAARQMVDVEGWEFAVRLYQIYQATLREQNAADFSDLLMWPTLALMNDRAYRARWSQRFTSVMADEFQDVNHAQMLWLTYMSEYSRELFAVGDDSQSIYSWRGAKIGFIRNFVREFDGAKLFKLEENFRSTHHILQAANAIIARDPGRIPKTLFTQKGDGQKIEVLTYDYASDEADAIAAEMGRRAAEGVAWHDMAMIYRINRLSRSLEEALLKARIPYEIIGDVGFYHRAVVKDALAFLMLAACPDSRQSDEAFRRVANVPRRGLGAKALGQIEQDAQDRGLSLCAAVTTATLPAKVRDSLLAFRETVSRIGQIPDMRLCDRLDTLLKETGYYTMWREAASEEGETALQNLSELVGLAEGFTRLQDLLEHAALATASPNERGRDRVQLMTMHRAKGLEFPHVFLPAWEETVFPGMGERNYEEERRLAYVSLTRAMQQATISSVGYRQGVSARPSGFIEEIPAEHRVTGWLRQQGQSKRRETGGRFRHTLAALDAMGF